MQCKALGFAQSLILLVSLLFVCSDTVCLETDSEPLEVSKKPDAEVAKFLFAIDRFSEQQKFAAPMGVFYDRHSDEIYVADTGNSQVDVFDAEGQPRFQISGFQGLKAPLDIVVDKESQIYVSQMGTNAIQILDFRGGHLADLYAPNSAPITPGRLCFDSEGNLYVADRKKSEILIYNATGDFQFRFGEGGEGIGKFRLISGVAVDSRGRIYVTDAKQAPIQVFDRKGRFLLSFGRRGVRDTDFAFPSGICIDEKDRIWIVDMFKHQVRVLKSDGTLLFQFGNYGVGPGQLFFPVDIALDGAGRAYVLEKGANRLQVFEIHGW